MFKRLQYLLYIAWNWNLAIAIQLFKEEKKGESFYGIQTSGIDELDHLEELGVDTEHATMYMPASYGLLNIFFETADVKNAAHFIDIGCGKGRAVVVAAHTGARNVTGVEFSKTLAQEAKQNVQKARAKFKHSLPEIVNNDAFYYHIPRDADVIFLFNPFDEVIMSGVIENIEMSLEEVPRQITVIYLNPLCKDLFLKAGYKQVFEYAKLEYLTGIILQK